MRDAVSGIYAGFRALVRDWHSGEIRLLLAALMTAVAAVASVTLLIDRIDQALQRDAAQMLGGDIVIRSGQPVADRFVEQARKRGLTTVKTMEFPSMLMHGSASQLVSVKAVSSGYPLRGSVRLQSPDHGPGGMVADGKPQAGTLWVDPQLPVLLQLSTPARVDLGDASLRIAGIIAHEPDRSMRFVNVAPRVLMAMSDIEQTGLLGPGARVTHRLLVAGPAPAVAGYQDWLASNLEPGQHLRTLENSQPGVQRTMDRANQFLTLVALLTVMLAGIAVALAARRFCLRHQDGIAIMRCLGASRRVLGWMILVEFLTLALIASAAGVALGYVIHIGLVAVVAAWMDVVLPSGSWLPYWKSMATGCSILLGFALPPLLGLRGIPPVRVLRGDAVKLKLHYGRAYMVGLLAFGALALALTGDPYLGFTVVAGFAIALTVFALSALGLVALVGWVRRHTSISPWLRFALAGISRRRALAVAQLCALAMGLAILLLLAILRTDLLQGWQNTIPPDAPNTFLINVQPHQRGDLATRLREAGLGTIELVPMVRARLTAINDTAVSADMYDDEQAQSIVNREFNLSHRPSLPASNTQLAGRWTNADDAEVSLETGLAKALGVGLGDTMTFDIAGQQRDVTIVGLRDVKWDSFDVNFFALLSEAVLRDAPATYIASLYFPENSTALVRTILDDFPNVTVFDLTVILAQVQAVLDHVIMAMQLLFLFSVAAGLVVLAAALFATRDERMFEAALLRALGASSAQLSGALRLEMIVLGTLAGVLAATTAQAIAYALATWVFKFDPVMSWWPWLTGALAGLVLALFSGRLALAGVLKVSPLSSLRATQ